MDEFRAFRIVEVEGAIQSALLIVLLLLAPWVFGCESTPPSAPSKDTSEETAADTPKSPPTIDADWVASKLQAPPPPAERDWAREIERDPIAALRQMDPGALQPKRAASQGAAGRHAARTKHRSSYDPRNALRGWPPAVGRLYPSIVLRDQTGQAVSIQDFQGKVVLIELVGLTCKACHAFSGGNEPGTPRFRGIVPQPGLPSIERFATGYANVTLERPDIVFVQLVLYGMDGQSPPSEEDVQDWAQHFGLRTSENEYVLIGDERFIGPESRALIPGFHLVDRNGILVSMSSSDPRHDPLHSALLPKLAKLVGVR